MVNSTIGEYDNFKVDLQADTTWSGRLKVRSLVALDVTEIAVSLAAAMAISSNS